MGLATAALLLSGCTDSPQDVMARTTCPTPLHRILVATQTSAPGSNYIAGASSPSPSIDPAEQHPIFATATFLPDSDNSAQGALPVTATFDDGTGSGTSEAETCQVLTLHLALDAGNLSTPYGDVQPGRLHLVNGQGTGWVGAAFNTMAEALDRTEAQRRQMVSDIAHELRNPLVTLNGTLEAIQDKVFEASPEVIDSLAEEARQLSHLVNDLADLNAAESGHLRLARTEVDLAAVARTVVDSHTPLARAAGLTLWLHQEVGGGQALVLGDEVRLRQVLTNLVSNAIRYSSPGGTVTVTTAVASGAAPTSVEVRVADQGVGIAPEQLPLVFDRLWRADAARTRATGGTGLGLAISRELVHAHRGELSVTSEPGAGSEFVLSPPAAP